MLTVHCATSLRELAAERDELNAINRASRLPDPFSTFEFYEIYFEYDEFRRHGVDSELWFLTVREEGRIVGYLPLRRVRDRALGIAFWKVELFATHDNDRPHLVARPADEARCRDAVFGWLRQRRRDWSFLDLRQQPADSVLCEAGAFAAPRYRVRTYPSPENGTIDIRWNTLRDWFGGLTKKMRNNLGRQFRALAAMGRLEHLASSDPAATPMLFELYQSIEARSWKAAADATISRSSRRIQFFQQLLGPRSPLRIRIDLLLLDSVPVAGLVCGGFERRLYALQTVFDDAYAHVGPGGAGLLLGLREAIDGGYLCFNLLSGFAYYKTRWQATVTKTCSVQIFRTASPRFLQALLGGLRRTLRPTPADEADFNAARRAAASPPAPITGPERARLDTLLAELARLGVRAEGAGDLARSLPFDLGRAPAPESVAASAAR